ncbi:MAG TPA: T9SS type A sorting domain-containing protein [bacterium]|nr:T9SS type A sorting domain-containing protein [bacterium]
MRRLILVLIFICTGIMLLSWLSHSTTTTYGYVVRPTNRQPIANARVREIGSSDFVLTNASGLFALTTNTSPGDFLNVSAGKEGWYNVRKIMTVGITDTIFLDPLTDEDNSEYTFQDPNFCDHCHTMLHDQWRTSKHARAATNPMFKQMYTGKDALGNANVYPGFKMDFPSQGGDCGDCHAPSAALQSPGNTFMEDVWAQGGVDTNGVHCDFCHKVQSVEVNYKTGVNGSLFVLRPQAHARDINFGPYDDVTTVWMGGTYNPVYEQSAYCSGCHQYANKFDVIVDDTYDSWAASTYADQGIQCQHCHMRPNSDSTFVNGISSVDAVVRDTNRVFSQFFQGTTEAFLKSAAKLDVDFTLSANRLALSSRVTNRAAGHKLPTGVSFRNMLLVVEVKDGFENLEFLTGDTLPTYAGIGSSANGNFSGLPGKGYAMLLRDGSGQIPAPNWSATQIIEDTRLPAKTTDTVRSMFRIGRRTSAQVHVRLLYRAVFKAWAEAKSWDMREFLMTDTTFTIDFDKPYQEPERVVLFPNAPNPFNGSTRITYDVPEDNTPVSVTVYNLLGQSIATLYRGKPNAGRHQTHWDGRNSRGVSVASGVYLCRLEAGNTVKTQKILYIK